MITIKEIAKLAETSRGTVDRVINNRGNVSPELERKIKDIIKEHQYESNPFARALVNSSKQYHIGVILNSIHNEFFNKIIDGIKDCKKEFEIYGIHVELIELFRYNVEEQLTAIEYFENKEVDGIVLTPINSNRIIEKLNNLEFPFVAINNDINANKLAFVGCDYFESGQLCGDLTNMMLSNGGDIIVVLGTKTMLGHGQRFDGLKHALDEKINIIEVIENYDDEQITYEQIKKSLEKHSNIDLICFISAGIKGCIKALIETKRSTKIICVDETDIVMKYLRNGKIQATVTQQPYKQGYQSINILCQSVLNNSTEKNIKYITENRVLIKNSKIYSDNKK